MTSPSLQNPQGGLHRMRTEKLQHAVAQVQKLPRARVTWLKRSLHTKDLREANVRAKPILIEFDHVLAKAEVLTAQNPEQAICPRSANKRRPISSIRNALPVESSDLVEGAARFVEKQHEP
jgi:hypothetical protein